MPVACSMLVQNLVYNNSIDLFYIDVQKDLKSQYAESNSTVKKIEPEQKIHHFKLNRHKVKTETSLTAHNLRAH